MIMDVVGGKIILIAGGSGLVGKALQIELEKSGHTVRILTRQKDAKPPYYHWNIETKEIDEAALKGVEVFINLSGAGIADKRWTEKRKQEIIDSRVSTTRFLFELSQKTPKLKHFISASGITCYGFEDAEKFYSEKDRFGDDYISFVVKAWEYEADAFSPHQKVAKVRTGIVLTQKGGALPKIYTTIKNYIGAPLGRGGQIMPWITLKDIARVYVHIVNNELEGAYNANSSNISNAQLTNAIAKKIKRPLWLPKVPKTVLKLMLGEMAEVVLNGVHADNTKLIKTNFEFKHKTIEEALHYIYDQKEKD